MPAWRHYLPLRDDDEGSVVVIQMRNRKDGRSAMAVGRQTATGNEGVVSMRGWAKA